MSRGLCSCLEPIDPGHIFSPLGSDPELDELTIKLAKCRAIKDKGMVFSNTWVYSKKDMLDIHTGWWSLVN